MTQKSKITHITVMKQRLRVEYTGFGATVEINSVNDIEDIESFFNATAFQAIYEETAKESLREHFDELYFIEEANGDLTRGN